MKILTKIFKASALLLWIIAMPSCNSTTEKESRSKSKVSTDPAPESTPLANSANVSEADVTPDSEIELRVGQSVLTVPKGSADDNFRIRMIRQNTQPTLTEDESIVLGDPKGDVVVIEAYNATDGVILKSEDLRTAFAFSQSFQTSDSATSVGLAVVTDPGTDREDRFLVPNNELNVEDKGLNLAGERTVTISTQFKLTHATVWLVSYTSEALQKLKIRTPAQLSSNGGAAVSPIEDDEPEYMLDAKIILQSASTYTRSLDVTAALEADDATEMYLTSQAGCGSGGSWETFTVSKNITLSSANSVNRIYVKFKDNSGNESSCVSDSIIHDNTAPSLPSSFNDGSTHTSTTTTPLISWGASTDNGSGVASYEVAIGTVAGGTSLLTWTDVGNVTSKTFSSLQFVVSTRYFASIRAKDSAGNTSTTVQGDGWDVTSGGGGSGSANQRYHQLTQFDFDLLLGSSNGTNLDGTGYVHPQIAINPDAESGYAIETLSDGKIIIAATSIVTSANMPYVVRLTSSGALDNTFGSNGANELERPAGDYIIPAAIKSVSGGFIVASNATDYMSFEKKIYVSKIKTDGTPETSSYTAFLHKGPSDSWAEPQILSVLTNADGETFVLVDPSISANGDSSYLFKLTSAGALDTTFASNQTYITEADRHLKALCWDQSGNIVATGGDSTASAATENMIVAKYTQAGTLVSSFDGDGIRIDAFDIGDGADNEYGTACAVDQSGNTYVAGYADTSSSTRADIIVKYVTNGSVDTVFYGQSGLGYQLINNTNTNPEPPSAAAVSSDGTFFYVVRYGSGTAYRALNPNGSLVTAFQGGLADFAVAGCDTCSSQTIEDLAVDHLGRIITVGRAYDSGASKNKILINRLK